MKQPNPPEPELDSTAAYADDETMFNYRDYGIEDYVALLIFWALCIDVFAQFFSRYVLGSSLGWTEEVARYLLITLTFVGSSMAIRRHTHIRVEYFIQFFNRPVQNALELLIDISRCTFFAILAYLAFDMGDRTFTPMAAIDFPKSAVYYAVSAGLAVMTLRSIQVLVIHAIGHWRRLTAAPFTRID